MKRRKFIQQSAFIATGAFAFPYINLNKYKLFPSGIEYSARAVKLVQESLIVDMLNQFLYGEDLDKWLENPASFKPEAARYLESGINVFALGHGARDKASALEYFGKWNNFIAANPESLKRIDTADDLQNITKSGKTGVLLSFQNSDHFEAVEDVADFYQVGQRISQLTYNYENKIASGAFSDIDNGITDFGKEIIAKMNESGMAIDLSHCSDKTTLEGIELSKKPVLITHANCRSLNPGYARAKTDEMIKNLAKKGGLFGVSVIRFMVKGDEPVTIEHFLDQYDHIIKLVGPEHAAIGSDLDLDGDDNPAQKITLRNVQSDTTGRTAKWKVHTNEKEIVGVEGVNHTKRMFDMVEGFIRRGYSDETIQLILGKNFLRFAREVWE